MNYYQFMARQASEGRGKNKMQTALLRHLIGFHKKILVHAILEMKKYNTLYHRQFPTGMFNLRPTGLMHSSIAMNMPNAKS